MVVKNIRRAIHGTCIAADTDAGDNADTWPSTVRVTLKRPRGGCLCLGSKSREVAKFTFSKGPRNYRYSNALLDLELLFKYSSQDDTQIKICVEQQQGIKRVARVPISEFMDQLLCNGPSQWVFLYIHREKVTLMPSNYPCYNDVPQWAFEGTGSAPQEETGYERHRTQEAFVVAEEIVNDILNRIERHEQKEDTTEKFVTEPNYECARVTSDECDILEITRQENNNINYKNENSQRQKYYEQVTDIDFIAEIRSLLENNKEEEDNDGPMVDWITHVRSLSNNIKEEEDNDGPVVDWVTHLQSLPENKEEEEDNDGPMVDWITHLQSLSENKKEEKQDNDGPMVDSITHLQSLPEKEEEQDNNDCPMTDSITYLRSLPEKEEEQDNNDGLMTDSITHLQTLSENKKEEEQDNIADHIEDNYQEAHNDTMTDTQPLNDDIEEEMADYSISLSRLMMSWHGAAIIVSFITLTAVFDEILRDGDWGWGWIGAFSTVSYFILTIALLDFFQEEN